ncbi:MAG TPA: hypothetical protein VF298_08180 [Bacteroidales bacterium]
MRLVKGSLSQSLLVLILIMLSFTKPVISQTVQATAKIDTAAISIGQQVWLHLNLTVPKKTKVIWPILQDSLTSHVEIVRKSAIDTSVNGDYINYSQRLTITSFDSGAYTIPPIGINYQLGNDTAMQHAFSQAVTFQVQTVKVDTTQAIRDIKGPMEAPLTFAEIIPWLLAVVALALVIFLFWYYLKQRKNNKPFITLPRKPKQPAYQIALDSLDELKSRKLWQNGRIKEYYSDLTDILRLYIEDQFGIAAIEMTTDEILIAFVGKDGGTNLLKRLRQILTTADLAKFAKAQPIATENELSLQNAIEFIKETIPAEPSTEHNEDKPENKSKLKA